MTWRPPDAVHSAGIAGQCGWWLPTDDGWRCCRLHATHEGPHQHHDRLPARPASSARAIPGQLSLLGDSWPDRSALATPDDAYGGRLREDDVVAWLRARGYRVTRGARTRVRDPDEARRLSRQCLEILDWLRARGPAGCWNTELATVALKYTGRVSELRGAGHRIEVVERDGPRRRYVLSEP